MYLSQGTQSEHRQHPKANFACQKINCPTQYLEDALSQMQWLLDWTPRGHHPASSFGPPKGITRKAAVVVEKKCNDLLPCVTSSVNLQISHGALYELMQG